MGRPMVPKGGGRNDRYRLKSSPGWGGRGGVSSHIIRHLSQEGKTHLGGYRHRSLKEDFEGGKGGSTNLGQAGC